MKKVLLVISLLLVVWCLAAQENSNTIIKGNETISVEDSVYEVKLKLSDPAENVHTEKLLINDNSQFNNPSRSTITRQGDNPSYGPWGSTITNSVFPNGHTPPFTSYLVLGEESENVGQGGINGGAGYILSGLPSGDISDYTDLDLKVYYYTTDECLWHETANNNHYTYDLYRGNGGLYHGEVGPLNDETNYVTTYDIRNTFIDAIIYGGQVQIELSSTDEIAINYVQLVYTYSPPEPADLDISNNNIPDPIPYTAGDYTLRVNNDGDETLYWNTSSIPSWASVNPSSGSVSGGSYTYVVVSFEQNNSSSSRNDNIEFYNTQNTSDDEWIYFEQEGIPDPANLDLSNNNIPDPIPYTGGVHTIRINNIGEQTLYWDTTSIPTWASVYSPSGSVNGGNYQTVNVYIDENTGTSSRNDDIKFYNTQNSSDYEWIYFEQEAPTYTVSGTVESDIHDFDKFVGVEVEIAGVASDITDSNGYFEIDNVPAGSQTISISHSGQAFTWENNQTTYNRTITVNGNETENFEGHCRANADIWIDCPSEFTTGQPFNVTVNLVNTNAVIMDVDANLDISFPDLTSGSNPFAVTNVSQNGFPAPSYVAAGDPNMWILDMSTGQWTQSPADFLLINGVRTETMYNNQTWSYTVQINPIDTETGSLLSTIFPL